MKIMDGKEKKKEELEEEESPPTLEVNVFDTVKSRSVVPGQLSG